MAQTKKAPKDTRATPKKRFSAATRCIGVDLRDDLVSIVELDMSKPQMEFIHNSARAVAPGENSADVLRSLVFELKLQGAPVVTTGATGLTHSVAGTYDGSKPNSKQIEDWAVLKALQFEDDEKHDLTEIRDKRVDATPPDRKNARLVSWMSESEASAISSKVKYATLALKAIDSPLLAFQRTYGISDPTTGTRSTSSILDLSHDRPFLYVFAEPIGVEIALKSSVRPEDLAREVLAKIRDLRQSNFVTDVPDLHIFGVSTSDKPTFITDLITIINRQDVGLEAKYLTVGGVENPAWAFANALATWSHPSSVMMRANLAPKTYVGPNIFGHELTKKDTVPLVGAVLAGVIAYGAGIYAFSAESASLQDQDRALQQQVLQISPRIERVNDLQTNLEKLREIDRNAYWLRYSGRLTALRLVQLGNAMPLEARATTISQGDSGWNISGKSKDPETLSEAQDGITKMSPGLNVRMQDEEQQGDTYEFNMRISDPPTTGVGPNAQAPVLPLQPGVVR